MVFEEDDAELIVLGDSWRHALFRAANDPDDSRGLTLALEESRYNLRIMAASLSIGIAWSTREMSTTSTLATVAVAQEEEAKNTRPSDIKDGEEETF
jgi:hypothetical protein